MSSSQLEHELIMASVVESTDKATATEIEEDTPLYRKKLQQVMGVTIIAAATGKDRNIKPIRSFVQKRDWEALRLAYGHNGYNVRNRLHVRDDCLLVDERIIISHQLRQIILDSLHLTQPGAAAMLDLSENIWFPQIYRKTAIEKSQSFQIDPVVEPNEEVQLVLPGPFRTN